MSATKSDHISPKQKDLHLPLSRVKTIMKSSPEVEAVGPEPLYLVTKVTVSTRFLLSYMIKHCHRRKSYIY